MKIQDIIVRPANEQELSVIKAFLEALKIKFEVAKGEAGDSKAEIVANLTQGFKDLTSYKNGTLKTTPAKDFLDEL